MKDSQNNKMIVLKNFRNSFFGETKNNLHCYFYFCKKIITILINKYLPCLNDCLKIGKNDIMSNY